MRSILNAGLAAVVGTLLCFGLSSALAQKSNQANKLEDKFLKLYDAGRYADAIPIAPRVLTIRDKALAAIIPMLQLRWTIWLICIAYKAATAMPSPCYSAHWRYANRRWATMIPVLQGRC
jgi:hypothetical protein